MQKLIVHEIGMKKASISNDELNFNSWISWVTKLYFSGCDTCVSRQQLIWSIFNAFMPQFHSRYKYRPIAAYAVKHKMGHETHGILSSTSSLKG